LALIAFIAAARQRSARGLMVFGIAAMLGFLVAAGHHLLTLWRDFGNPVFPLFNNIFQSPYVATRRRVSVNSQINAPIVTTPVSISIACVIEHRFHDDRLSRLGSR
jgi:hypothetical protein